MQVMEQLQAVDEATLDQGEDASQSRDQTNNSPLQVIQHDLAQNINLNALQNYQFGRRKPNQDLCKDVKDALKWEEPDTTDLFSNVGASKNKNFDQVTQIQMQKSP